MPTYAAAGIVGGVIALGFLIWSIWSNAPQPIEQRNSFRPPPGYDRPRTDSDWDTQSGRRSPRRRSPRRRNRDPSKCPICLEVLAFEDLRRKLSCGHDFHHECLFTWLKAQDRIGQDKNCPICRKLVVYDD